MRLIDADALMERMTKAMESGSNLNGTFHLHIEHAPTKDAVEVVRCKDCKHRHEDGCPMYFEEQIDIDEGDGYYDTEYIIHDYTQDDGYCSLGERREP